MDTVLWILRDVLAAPFLATGLTKLTQPRAKMAGGPMRWAADVSDARFRSIGLLAAAGAVGIILPAALGIAPALSAFAAVAVLALAPLVAVERFGAHAF